MHRWVYTAGSENAVQLLVAMKLKDVDMIGMRNRICIGPVDTSKHYQLEYLTRLL
jgi:hypothetical protein